MVTKNDEKSVFFVLYSSVLGTIIQGPGEKRHAMLKNTCFFNSGLKSGVISEKRGFCQ